MGGFDKRSTELTPKSQPPGRISAISGLHQPPGTAVPELVEGTDVVHVEATDFAIVASTSSATGENFSH